MDLEYIFEEVQDFMQKKGMSFYLLDKKIDFKTSDIDIILRNELDLDHIKAHMNSNYKLNIINERRIKNQYYVLLKDREKIHALDFCVGLTIKGYKLIDSSFFFTGKEENINFLYKLIKSKFKNNEKEFLTILEKQGGIKKKYLSFIFKIKKGFVSRNGKLIAFFGVDGAGKSTAIDELVLRFTEDRKLLNISKYHFRPKILKGSLTSKAEIEKSISAPHMSKRHNSIKSVFKVLFIVLNYVLFIPLLYTKKTFGKTIFFDRYYNDIFFDEKRYRLNKSGLSVARFFLFLIPKPDYMFFVLGDENIIYSRKQDIEIEEIISIQKKYADYFENNHERSIIIMNNNSRDSFISKVEEEFISIL
ncbi:hypothetical protein [Algibacter mikhailovii]|uniref:hypothetical protein n=1 Tax=Algibacter mikhailovii TaxID=425498 RepID=UPI00249533DC|nr:hypothetical protein [Algibacter mikhailovii]